MFSTCHLASAILSLVTLGAIKASAEFIALREEVLKIIFADEAGALDE
jgi:ABC-type taurine transport system ATPase subunit